MAQPYVFFDNYAGPVRLHARPTRAAKYAREMLATTTGAVITGDGLVQPFPLVLPVYLQADSALDLFDALYALISKAKTATTVTYHDGTAAVADREVGGLVRWKVTRCEPVGLLLSLRVAFAARGPYWISRSSGRPEVWEW